MNSVPFQSSAAARDSVVARYSLLERRFAGGAKPLLRFRTIDSVSVTSLHEFPTNPSMISPSPDEGIASPTPAGYSASVSDERLRRSAHALKLAAAGDAKAYEVFYRETFSFAHAIVRRVVGHNHVDDVLSETYVQVWRDAKNFDATRGNAFAWVITIARSRAIDRLRREQVRHGGLNGAIEMVENAEANESASDDINPESLVQAMQSKSALRDAVAQLSATERWCLGLAYFKDMTHSEIAAATQLPIGTVKSLITRSQQKLRLMLASGGEGAPSKNNQGALQ